jgi:hypothetical protein
MYRQILVGSLAASCLLPALAEAGIRTKAIQEAIEFAGKKFGKEVAEEGVERLSSRMMQLAARHGDDVVVAVFKKVGPRAGKIVGEAGEHGGVALRLLAKHGDDALPLVTKAASLKAAALLKHGSVGESLVEQFAKEGVEALGKVSPQNGRRLAMLATEGQLKPELLTVVSRYGDTACDFIWRNKGALAIGTAMTAFVAAPEQFFDGTAQLTEIVAEAAVKPLAEIPKAVAEEAAANTNWNLVWLALGSVAGIAAWRFVRGWQSVSSGLSPGTSVRDKAGSTHPAERSTTTTARHTDAEK